MNEQFEFENYKTYIAYSCKLNKIYAISLFVNEFTATTEFKNSHNLNQRDEYVFPKGAIFWFLKFHRVTIIGEL